MTARYRNLMFGDAVKQAQTRMGSREMYGREAAEDAPDQLTANEAAFIAARDSFYLASSGAGGWPYLQHRGGPAGFVKILDAGTLGFADYRGNRQYISVGNMAEDDRVALFFMDYANRARLKLLGRMRAVDLDDTLAAQLTDPDYRARPERGLLITVEAYDWNCSQHITPRYPEDQVTAALAKLQARIAELEQQLAAQDAGA